MQVIQTGPGSVMLQKDSGFRMRLLRKRTAATRGVPSGDAPRAARNNGTILLPTQPDDRGGLAYEKHRFQNRRFEKHSRKSENGGYIQCRPEKIDTQHAFGRSFRQSRTQESQQHRKEARNRPPTTRRTTARTRMPDPIEGGHLRPHVAVVK